MLGNQLTKLTLEITLDCQSRLPETIYLNHLARVARVPTLNLSPDPVALLPKVQKLSR